MKLAASLILSLCICAYALGQQIQFATLSEENGLPNEFVTDIYQDEKGFIWLCTASGISRYEGYHIEYYKPNSGDSSSLSHINTWSICGDGSTGMWIGTSMGLNHFDPRIEQFTRFYHDPSNKESLSNNYIEKVYLDKKNTLWVGTQNGLNKWIDSTKSFERYFHSPSSPLLRSVRGILEDRTGNLWVSVNDSLYLFDRNTGKHQLFEMPAASDPYDLIRVLYEDSKAYLWIGTEKSGLFQFDLSTKKFVEHFFKDPDNPNSLSNNRVNAILEYEHGDIWVGTHHGLNIISNPSKQILHICHHLEDKFSLSANNVKALFLDKDRNVWLGTDYGTGGANILLKNKKAFRNFSHIPGKPSSLNNNICSGYLERENGDIWVSTQGGGINVFHPKEGTFDQLPQAEDWVHSQNLTSILEDREENIWISSNVAVSRFNPKSGSSQQYYSRDFNSQNAEGAMLTILFMRKGGEIWLASHDSPYKYDPIQNTFVLYPLPRKSSGDSLDKDNHFVLRMFEDSEETFWLSTHGGLNQYLPQEDRFAFYPYHKDITSIHEGPNGILWLGTFEGLVIFDRKKKKFEPYDKVPKLKEEVILGILEDPENRLWLATNKGIVLFDPENNYVKHYNKKDGLANNQFMGAFFEKSDGEFYFSGINGFTAFFPNQISENKVQPSLVLTDFRIHNEEVSFQDFETKDQVSTSPLSQKITYTQELHLEYWQNNLEFKFSAIDFTAPENIQYKYRLVNLNDNWIETHAENRVATFTNLDPGNYMLQIRAANNDGLWSAEGINLKIFIAPPWYANFWAYTFYLICLFALLYFIYQFQLSKKLAENESQRLKEIDTLKMRLYTNITHEFRSPLTSILGMATQIKEHPEKWFQDGTSTIIRNSHQLLRLVNQMLDLSKVEAGYLQLHLQQGDIIHYIRYLTEAFHSLAESKHIRVHVFSKVEELSMDFDPDRLRQILSNLLSNAIKFTPSGGDIYLQSTYSTASNPHRFILSIRDTGIGIPKDRLPFVFDRFYQVEDDIDRQADGSGIGLSLTKELVELMRGEIEVKSTLGKGSEFTIQLPVTQKAPLLSPNEISEYQLQIPAQQSELIPLEAISDSVHLAKILIIEDNVDVVKYLMACLHQHYSLDIAYNGQEGIEKALDLIPELIISDVMMPIKDGLTVCDTLKNHPESRHIPIILLTARVDIASKLEGIRRGADAYLPKPFNQEELALTIQNLLTQRKNLHSYYISKLGISSELLQRPSQEEVADEDPFIEQLKQMISENLSNPEFSVEWLAHEIGVSPVSLHRKLKQLCGQSTQQLIIAFRLNKAKDLLIKSSHNISEIGYAVGFNDPNYFSQAFKKLYHLSPSEFRLKFQN